MILNIKYFLNPSLMTPDLPSGLADPLYIYEMISNSLKPLSVQEANYKLQPFSLLLRDRACCPDILSFTYSGQHGTSSSIKHSKETQTCYINVFSFLGFICKHMHRLIVCLF